MGGQRYLFKFLYDVLWHKLLQAGILIPIKIRIFAAVEMRWGPDVPIFVIDMLTKQYIQSIIAKALEGTTVFVVDINISSANKVDVFIDKPEGIVVADCVKINRLIANDLETQNIDADITVSSPGLEEPLKVTQQYVKNIGRQVRVITKTGEEKTGKLLAADIEGIELETIERVKNGNKKENATNHYQFTYGQLAKTQIVLSFK